MLEPTRQLARHYLNVHGVPPKGWSLAEELEAKGWKEWLTTIFPFAFPSEFSWFHAKFWENWWEVCQSIKHNRPIPPKKLNFLLLWGRALAKSSSGTPSTLMKAAFAGRTYSIYLSETIDQSSSHLANIRNLITHPDSRLVEFYPHLELTPLVPTSLGLKSKDTENVFITKGGSIFRALGIESAARGLILAGKRPDDFNIDDIDDVSHGIMVSKKNLRRLTRSVLLTRDIASDLVVTTKILQNIVTETGVVNQIHTGKSDAFSERTTIGVVNTFEKLDLENYIDDNGMMRNRILPTSIPSWEAVSIPKAQAILDLIGLDSFLAECHPAGTRVRAGFYTNVKIEDIQVGDLVLTHANRRRRVTELIRRNYSGNLHTIRVAGSQPLTATANHPLLVARRPRSHFLWHIRKDGRDVKDPSKLNIDWRNASDVGKGDFLLEPIPTEPEIAQDGLPVWTFEDLASGRPVKGNKTIRATPELFRLLGYYLAEGRVDGAAVRLTFHENEVEYIEDVAGLFETVFGKAGVIKKDNGRSRQVHCSSTIAARFFQQCVGTGSHFKTVPEWAFGASNQLLEQIVIGYIRGDGFQCPTGFGFNTVSAGLADTMRLVLLRLGIVASMYLLKSRQVKLPQGSLYQRSEHWQGAINGANAEKLGYLLNIPFHSPKGRTSNFIANGYLYRSVRSVTVNAVENYPVFNMEVEEDESYLAENVISHNCQNKFDQFRSGRVISNYDEDVQLITWSDFERMFGQRRIPAHWGVMAGLDVGFTEGEYPHYSAWDFIATAAMNSPLPNSLFLYRSRTFKGVSIDDQAEAIKRDLYPEEMQMVKRWQMSHEASGVMMTLKQRHNLPFAKSKHYGAEDGVAQWQHLSMSDTSKPHPFFPDEVDDDGKYLLGRPTLFYIVDDDQRVSPRDDNGLKILREQVSTWEYVQVKLTDSGQTVQKPSKVNDDHADVIKGLLGYWGARATDLTPDEKVEAALPEPLREVALAQIDDQRVKDALLSRRRIEVERVSKDINKPVVPAHRLRFGRR